MFIKAWLVAREAFYVRHGLDVRFDENGKQYRLPLKWKGLAGLRADTDTWKDLSKLRRVADRNCMPYKMFWQIGFRVLADMDEWKKEVKALAGDVFLRGSIIEEFEEIKRSRIIMSDAPHLKAGNFNGLPHQKDYMEYLLTEVLRRYPLSSDDKIKTLVQEGRLFIASQPVQAIN